jgi:hypothetical protein
VGGAYIYIDPTPSKNVFKANIDVDHVSGCAIPAMGCAPCLAGGGPWDERGPALCRARGRAWGQLAHAWGIMALPYAQPFHRRRRRHSDKTFPPRGGNLSVGVPLADLARQIQMNPDVYSICAVGDHFQPDKAHLSAAFLRISPIPLRLLEF